MTFLTSYLQTCLIPAFTTSLIILLQTQPLLGDDEHCLISGDGNTVNLDGLDVKDTPTQDGFSYRYNCMPFNYFLLTNIVIAQIQVSGVFIPVGTFPPAPTYSNGILTYTVSTSDSCPNNKRTGLITVTCGTNTEFTFINESPICTYNFDLEVPANVCSSTGGMAISIGSLLIILFFLCIVIYLVCGILINHFCFDATGLDMIPNLEFWKAFPGLVLDGFIFVFSCCKKDQTYDRI